MRIWCDFKPGGPAAQAVQRGTYGHDLIFDEHGASPRDADIALGQPDPAAIIGAPGIQWLHITSAGYTKFDYPEFWTALRTRHTRVTNSSSVFADPCAQHALAMILSFARALPWSLTNQFPASPSSPNLAPNLNLPASPSTPEPSHPNSPTWTQDPIRKRSFLLTDQHILLVGYGAIARRLAQLLAPFTPHIVGIRRTPRGNEPIRTVPLSAAAPELATADHVVNILPQSLDTENFFDAPRLAQLKPGAFFYNIGRGKTVHQPSLIAALASGQIAAAYLDVTDPEPLPPTHPLWTIPNCFITPHSAGGHHNERDRLTDHFLTNLRRFETHQTLLDRID